MAAKTTFTARAKRVRMLVMDVDGVMTDGRMVLSERGDELKRFHTHDGIGLELARRAGFRTAMVTGEKVTIAERRGAKLGVDRVVLGARRKGEVLAELTTEFGVTVDEVAYIGDDLIDIPALERAGLAIAPADAAAEVRALAHLVTKARGGEGVVREAVETILRARGVLKRIVGEFVRDHGGVGARWR